jgi:hypothetical protein
MKQWAKSFQNRCTGGQMHALLPVLGGSDPSLKATRNTIAWRALALHPLPNSGRPSGRDQRGGFTNVRPLALSTWLASRPAKVGDQLVTTKFGGFYTTGFCEVGKPDVAVCVKPGTELAFEREIEAESLWFKRCAGSQLARFRRVNEDRVCVHHDALELPSGKVVLLTRLLVGQRATVLQLPVAERVVERPLATTTQPTNS